ncbi:MAG: alkaline phosphatase family protein [Bryobacteraceae bacterium]
MFATSQHPDFAVDAGEALISEVYSAVRDSPLWNDALLLIVYDEHGGLFDHVTPPTLVRDPQFPDIPASQDFGFKFDRLGVRVPAVFISPWIQAGTILHRPFDHCSIVATVRKLFCLDKAPFNWREGQAATFEDIANLAAMRQDKPNLPNATASDGTIPLPRAVVLSDADRAAANAAMTAAGMPPAPHVADQNPITPDAAAVPAANGQKPTQLTLQIAQAAQNTLTQMGKKTTTTAEEIETAQEAADFLGEAMALMGRTTGAGR